MRVHLLFLIFFISFPSVFWAQSRSSEKLNAKLDSAAADTQQVNLLVREAEKLADRGELGSAEDQLAQAEELARTLGYSYGQQLVYLNQAYFHLLKMEHDAAQEVLETALQEYPESSLANAYYNHLGTVYRFRGEAEQALRYYNLAIARSDTTEEVRILASIKQNMAVVYQNMGNKAKAMSHYLDGLEFAETVKDTVFLATLVNNIGEAYTDFEEYDKASHYLQQSIELSRAIGFKVGLLRASFNMGNVKNNTGELDAALRLYQRSLQMSEEIRPGQPPVRIHHNLGRLYHKMGDLGKAEEYLHESLAQSEAMNIVQGVYYNSKELGNLASDRKDFEEALKWYEKALAAAKESGSLGYQQESNKKLYELYKTTANYERALEHLEELHATADSLNQLEKDQALAEHEARLNMHRQEQINQLLEAKQQEQEARLNIQQWLIVIGFLAIVLITAVVLLLIRTNAENSQINKELEKQKKELEQLNQVKNKLFAVVAHDLRTPLSGLKGMLYLFREEELSGDELRVMSAHLEVSMQHSLNIMENLLLWARQQMEGINIDTKPVQAKEIVDKILSSHVFHAEQKGIQLANTVSQDVRVLTDPDLLELVLRNLVSNSLKFSEEGDCITVSADSRSDDVLFVVEDTGIGIPEAQKPAIFQFGSHTRKGTNNEHGSGLGLNLCKEFVEKQGGTMFFESEEGKGASFYFSLPKPG